MSAVSASVQFCSVPNVLVIKLINNNNYYNNNNRIIIIIVITTVLARRLFVAGAFFDGLEAFTVDDRWSGFVVFLFADPHLLEGGERSQD